MSTSEDMSQRGVERQPSQRSPIIRGDESSRHNARTWTEGDFLAEYARRNLTPAEAVILLRYREGLAGRVLELGCGGGRVTGYLMELAQSVHGIDVSPKMVEYCRSTYPGATFDMGDLRDLTGFADGEFDAIVAPFCVIDVLDDPARRHLLDEVTRLLTPRGLFVASSHNLAFVPHNASPTNVYSRNPVRLVKNIIRLPLRVRNRRRLLPMQKFASDHAILVDEAHDFTLIHYYITRDAQARQLGEHAFEFLDCLDQDGIRVAPGSTADQFWELYYVARRAA